MYQVRCDNYVIYDLRDDDLKIISPKLTTELGKTGTFDFTIPPQNTNYDKIKKLKSIITIYQDGEEIWRGRVLNDKLDFYNRKQVECEGELAFLLDTIQRPFEFQGTPKELFQKFINSHNSEVEEQKRFKIRNVTVTDTNDYINRENSSYATTWDSINDKLVETNGGYLETGPLENGERYIDYISEYTQINSQTIEFGKNLLDITQYAKGEDIKTAIIPIGKDKLNIASINNNKDYIYNETAVNLFGWIFDTVEYNDITLAENLLKKGTEYLENVINEKLTIELTAVDLHYLNCDISKFRKGDWVRVISKPHSLDKLFQVTKLSISLDNPKSSKLTLGQTFSTLTQKNNKESKTIVNTVNILSEESKQNKENISSVQENVTNLDSTIIEINKKFGGVYTVKGSIEDYETLMDLENMKIGDVYNLLSTGANYVYTDSGWDKLSETIDLSIYLKAQDAESKYAKIEDLNNLINRVEILENNGGVN